MELKAIAKELDDVADEVQADSEYFRQNPIIHDWADRVKIYAERSERLREAAKELRAEAKEKAEPGVSKK